MPLCLRLLQVRTPSVGSGSIWGFTVSGLGLGFWSFFGGASSKVLVEKGFRGFRAKGSRGIWVRFRVR